ncbi:MAG TPA: phosphatase PAP2 family protein [Allosphingosinicella sp.]|jgi:membrane-associated phospholipid phosphatase
MSFYASEDQGRDDAAWGLIALTALLFLALQAAETFEIVWSGVISPASIFLLLLGAEAAARLSRRVHPLAAALPFFRQVLLFSCLGAALSYQVAAQAGSLWDPGLGAVDRALGFDSAAFLRFLDSRPLLAALNEAMYHSLIPQLVVLLLALAWMGRVREMRVLLLASIASGLLAILISAMLPAAGNLFAPADYPELGASAAWLHRADIAGLRDGSLRSLDLAEMKGIVTFPSYHAALATIYIAAFRSLPALRWVGGLWALLTIAATPAGGGHYLVDVLAGVLLALGAVAFARRAIGWSAAETFTLPLRPLAVPLRKARGRRSA